MPFVLLVNMLTIAYIDFMATQALVFGFRLLKFFENFKTPFLTVMAGKCLVIGRVSSDLFGTRNIFRAIESRVTSIN